MSFQDFTRRSIAVACILTLGSSVSLADKKEAGSKEEEKKVPITVFADTTLEKELYDPVVFGGFVEAEEQLHGISYVEGTLSKLHVRVGSIVKAGQQIASVIPAGFGLDYKQHVVRAPLAGVVISLKSKQGDYVTKNSLIATVAKENAYRTTIKVTYDDIFKIKLGQILEAKVEPGSEQEITTVAVVKAVGKVADPATQAYPVELSLKCKPNNSCNKILIGSLVKITLKKNLRKGIRISVNHLFQQRKKMIVIDKANKVKWIDVKLGTNYGDEVEIIEGIAKGTKYVTSFSTRPEDGDKIIVTTPESEIAGKNSTKAKKG